MKFLRDQLDRVAPLFEKGGKLEKLYPIYEAQDTILFTPGEVTKGKTHVRDALDLKRMMIMVVVALVPAILMALYNTGLQANTLIHGGNAQPLDAWQTSLFHAIAGSYEPTLINNVLHGAMWFIPLFAITGIVGGLVEVHTFMRKAIQRGRLELIPWLFVGRLSLRDLIELSPWLRSGWVAPPLYQPRWAQQLPSLTAFLLYSVFVNGVSLREVGLEEIAQDGPYA